MREVRRAGDAFRCPACAIGWVHLPPLVPVRGQARYVRCDRCRALYRVRGVPGADGDRLGFTRREREQDTGE